MVEESIMIRRLLHSLKDPNSCMAMLVMVVSFSYGFVMVLHW